MSVQMELTAGTIMLAEIQEFGDFDPEVQRYICRSLEIAHCPDVSVGRWARDENEANGICTQKHMYRLLPAIRKMVPIDSRMVNAEEFLFPLVAITTMDLACGPISAFAQYRFLYERLLCAMVRPWLPAAFRAAVALPHFPAHMRQKLIGTVTSAFDNRWSVLEPTYFPTWLGDREVLVR